MFMHETRTVRRIPYGNSDCIKCVCGSPAALSSIRHHWAGPNKLFSAKVGPFVAALYKNGNTAEILATHYGSLHSTLTDMPVWRK